MMCTCGHTAHWHGQDAGAPDASGACEHDADCCCERFSAVPDQGGAACHTPGALFETRIGGSVVAVTVRLPAAVQFTEAIATALEPQIHDAMESILAPYWVTSDEKRQS